MRYAVVDRFYWRPDAHPPKFVASLEEAEVAKAMLGDQYTVLSFRPVHRRFGANETKLTWHCFKNRPGGMDKHMIRYLKLEDPPRDEP